MIFLTGSGELAHSWAVGMTTSKNGGQGSRVPTDTALIAAARRGDVDAFDSLTDRHRDAAVRLTRRTVNGPAEELVDAAVAAARTELRAGAGPRTAFRPYLLTLLRRQNSGGLRRGRRSKIDEGTGSAFPAACIATTGKAFHGLPEEAQVALWHTEVEGEPLLETGKLLGLEATRVAELSFSARDAIRAAQLLEHRAAITSPQCRWTTNRLNGYARHTLSQPDTTKVTEHLDTCDLCAGVAPAVLAVEADLPLLIATVVLGPAAQAYLGREGAGHARHGRIAGLMHDAARPVAVAISAIALITAGLLGTLAFADEDAAEKKVATPTTFTAIPVAPTSPDDDSGPDSGEGSTGRDRVAEAAPPVKRAPATTTVDRAFVPDVRPEPAQPAQPAPKPQESSETEDSEETETHSLDLGVAQVNITPGAGLLGLPGLSFG